MANKQDSNQTGLAYAEETTIGTLPGTPVWWPLEPNSYQDFGGSVKLLARNPINASRQRKKGVITDLDASGGFNQDLTQNNITRLMQGFSFASIREKLTTAPTNSAALVITGVTASSDTYAAASGLGGFILNDLVLGVGFSQAANNGLKLVASSTSGTVVVNDGTVDETPTADAKLLKVGHQFASATVDIVVSGSYPRLNRASGAKDFTTFGLIPGEWIFIGGDSGTLAFTNPLNNGFCRVRAVAAGYIEFDKTTSTMAAETGTGKTVQIFFGNVIKNESVTANIVRRTYNVERQVGSDTSGVMSEYLVGAVPNDLTINVKQADKVNLDMTFVAKDNEQRTGAVGIKAGTRKTLPANDPAFNTTSDFTRIKMHVITAGETNSTPLFAFLTDLTVKITNKVSPNKAIAVLGAFDMTAGMYEVSASLTAYFADLTGVTAVRNNADVSLDFALVKNNAGFVFDIPLVALGDARLKVEQDKPIQLPLTLDAAAGGNDHTFLFNEFPYLPTAAQ